VSGTRGASALTREAIAAIDASGMLRDVLDQPAQLEDALWRADSAGIARAEAPGGLVVAGMGGSAIGGDLAVAIIGDRARAPVQTVRGYSLPPWIGPDTLVLCSSYSGQTEETLSAYRAAGELGAPRAVVTTGGELGELARADGVPVIGVPSGMLPRAAVAYMTVSALECAAACGASPSLRPEVEAAASRLRSLAEEWGPESPDDSGAKALAARLRGTVPVVYGAGSTAPVARRWKAQLNENPSIQAFASELPEADHNEVCGYADSRDGFSAVFLDDPTLDPRLRRRIELTAELLEPGTDAVERVESRGETAADRVLSLVLLGDLVSIYLAALLGVDPSPMEAIERLKGLLDANVETPSD
jgi:glucose/mannose-6-phosphate isomerase